MPGFVACIFSCANFYINAWTGFVFAVSTGNAVDPVYWLRSATPDKFRSVSWSDIYLIPRFNYTRLKSMQV